MSTGSHAAFNIFALKDRSTTLIDINAVKKSTVLAEMAINCNVDLDDPSCTVDVDCPVGTKDAMKKVDEWILRNYDTSPRTAITPNNPSCILSDEDNKFMDVNNNLLVEILQVANFLDIDDLVDIITQKIAGMARNKSPGQLRKLFKLPDDLSKEEKWKICEENQWAHETQ